MYDLNSTLPKKKKKLTQEEIFEIKQKEPKKKEVNKKKYTKKKVKKSK